ncbi:BON domain-containing protein [Burkholderia anthina]|uniref:BON domain-containing protein n=1 Tax=Burkholderia anthina TaxID=179879 RepID=UPI001AA08349|nr:BON domain-containing protein [Burkholderia anthina]QTD94582.1 BON domain-containing protein [Burkholderia anthina]
MKNITRDMIAGAFALLSFIGVGANAQPGESAVSSGATPASSAKQMRAADRALQKSLRHALAKTKGLDVINMTVRARGGDVVLEGSVPAQSQIEQATRVAQSVPGVNSVKNALIIHIPQ